MTTFYIKNEDSDEYTPADDQVDELFRQKSDKIVSNKLSSEREKVQKKIREEIAAKVREEETEAIRADVTKELSADYQKKVDAAEEKAAGFETQLRAKTIAAEYGFGSKAEQFLGNGSEEEMRAKADDLKESFAPKKGFEAPDKQSTDSKGSSSFVKWNGIEK